MTTALAEGRSGMAGRVTRILRCDACREPLSVADREHPPEVVPDHGRRGEARLAYWCACGQTTEVAAADVRRFLKVDRTGKAAVVLEILDGVLDRCAAVIKEAPPGSLPGLAFAANAVGTTLLKVGGIAADKVEVEHSMAPPPDEEIEREVRARAEAMAADWLAKQPGRTVLDAEVVREGDPAGASPHNGRTGETS